MLKDNKKSPYVLGIHTQALETELMSGICFKIS